MRSNRDLDLAIGFTRLELNKLQHRVVQMRRSLSFKEYNPSQPRIPAKQTGGGRWTSASRSEGSNSIFYAKFNELIHHTSITQVECDEMHRRDLIV